MYFPNEHLGAAHRSLLYVTSGEVDAANHPDTAARRYDNRQRLSSGQWPLRNEHSSATNHALSFNDYVDRDRNSAHLPKPRADCQASNPPNSFKRQHVEYRLPTPPPSSKSLRPVLARVDHPEIGNVHHPYLSQRRSTQDSRIPNGLSSSHQDLPQLREHLARGPNTVNATGTNKWNTDGTRGEHEDWALHQSRQYFHTQLPTWDYSPVFERQPQLSKFATTYRPPRIQPRVLQYAPPLPPRPRRALPVAASPTLVDGHSTQLPAIQEWRTDNLSK